MWHRKIARKLEVAEAGFKQIGSHYGLENNTLSISPLFISDLFYMYRMEVDGWEHSLLKQENPDSDGIRKMLEALNLDLKYMIEHIGKESIARVSYSEAKKRWSQILPRLTYKKVLWQYLKKYPEWNDTTKKNA